VSFFIDANDPALLPVVGDGLLPGDLDGKQKPMLHAKIPLVGTQDDGGGYGATFDAVNIWDLAVKWRSTPTASLALNAQLPVAAFDSIFPVVPRLVTASRSPGSQTRISIWTCSRTASGSADRYRFELGSGVAASAAPSMPIATASLSGSSRRRTA
jgi:hypothetical protein